MSLPKIQTPTYTTTLPISGKKIKYRPFLVKEEKMIILAITETDENLKARNLMDSSLSITQNCVLTPDVDVRDLAIGDFEWLFMKLRMVSKGESVMLNIKCIEPECRSENPVKVNLKDCKVDGNTDNKLDLGNDITAVMKFPTMGMVLENLDNDTKDHFDLRMIYQSLDMIMIGNNVYEDFTYEEFDEFAEQFTSLAMEKIKKFFDNLPTIVQTVEFECLKCKAKNELMLKGSKDFFV